MRDEVTGVRFVGLLRNIDCIPRALKSLYGILSREENSPWDTVKNMDYREMSRSRKTCKKKKKYLRYAGCFWIIAQEMRKMMGVEDFRERSEESS